MAPVHPVSDANLAVPDDPSDTQPGKTSNGYRKILDEAEIKDTNVRIIGNIIRFKTNSFFMPAEQPMQLVLLRIIFNHLRNDHHKKCRADTQGVSKHDSQKGFIALASSRTHAEEDKIPTHTFVRCFERLFFLLCMKDDDLTAYDANSDGYVTWAEFFDVYRRRNITVKWTLCERIFYTLEDPDSSIFATIVSFFVLLVIITSSFCFIFSTVPAFQENLNDKDGPKPIKTFHVIDSVCLVIFVVEYLLRLLTCWNVRTEISRKNQTALVTLVVGYGPICLPSPVFRVIYFFFAPANLVDLVAILPGVLGAFVDIDGGGFVVLRLIRLTRLFRVLKSRSLIEPLIIIGRTLQQSTSALYILMFILLLGAVISGSLIYIVEGLGEWSVEKQVYLRDIKREWNSDAGEFRVSMDETPFKSIPHSFWWALVTIMTVGYGDDYPTTGLGKVIAAGTMVFSLVMLALPVGVVGGNFSQVWTNFEQTKKDEDQMMKHEQQFVITQMAKLDPDKLKKTMLVEVWDDSGIASEGMRQGPRWNYFMGQATCNLILPCDENFQKEVKLKLESNPDIVDRSITGSIIVRYKWTPDLVAQTNSGKLGNTTSGSMSQLSGSLQVTIVSGHRLLNLVTNSKKGASSPYCRVYVYPTRPKEGTMLTPAVWRSPTRLRTLSPVWNVTDTFVYDWHCPDHSRKMDGRINICSPVYETSSCCQSPKLDDDMLDEALMALQILYTDMHKMKETISILDERVGIMSKEEMERLKALEVQRTLQANDLGMGTQVYEESEETEDGEVPESEPKDLSSVGSEESV